LIVPVFYVVFDDGVARLKARLRRSQGRAAVHSEA